MKIKPVLAVFCIAASFSASFHVLAAAALVSIVMSCPSMTEFRNIRFYFFMFLFALIPAIFLPAEDLIPFAVRIVLRMAAVYGGFMTLVSDINLMRLHRLAAPLLGDDFSKSLTLAMNLFPSMRRDLRSGWAVLNLNSRRRPPVLGFPRMAVRCAVRYASETSLRLKAREERLPKIIIVSGPVNSGKTAVLEKYIDREKADGNTVTGIIAKGVYTDGRKSGYDVTDVSTGETRKLAGESEPEEGSFRFGRFCFSVSGFEFAETALVRSLDSGAVFLDEAGPLELEDRGYAACLRKLLESDIKKLYISVRDSSLPAVKEKFFPGRDVEIISTRIPLRDV